MSGAVAPRGRRRRDLDDRLARRRRGAGPRPGRSPGRRTSRRSGPRPAADGARPLDPRRPSPTPGSSSARSRSPAWAWPGSTGPRTSDGSRPGPPSSTWARRLVLVNDGDLVVAAGTPEGWGVGRDRRHRLDRRRPGPRRPDRPGGRLGPPLRRRGERLRRRPGRAPPGRPPGRRPRAAASAGRRPARRAGSARPWGSAGRPELVSAIYREGFDRARIAALAPAVVGGGGGRPVDLRRDPRAGRRRAGPDGRGRGPAARTRSRGRSRWRWPAASC